MRKTLFWSSVGFVIYTYLLFPLVVFLRGRVSRQPFKSEDITPSVSMIVAAYNEAANIRAKIQNALEMDYPADCFELVIASDGSNDGTDKIVRQYADQGVKLLSLPRQGKAAALNAAVEASSGEILVFSDANSLYAPDAIRALTRPFADREVGGVAGNQVYLAHNESAFSGDGEHSYWSFDRKLKQSQSQSGNVVSATGAIYAIRRSLFRGVPVGVTDDFATSTSIIAQGYRLVFAPDAIAYEPAAESGSSEFRRKVRIITRGLRGVLLRRELLNPFQYGFYAIQLLSHKVLRRMVVFPLLILLVVSPLLWMKGVLYRLATLAQLVFYGCGLLGFVFEKKQIGRLKVLSLPFFFCMVNAASFMAALNVMRGRRIDFWEPQRAQTQVPAQSAVAEQPALR